jgi:hypothetical protein
MRWLFLTADCMCWFFPRTYAALSLVHIYLRYACAVILMWIIWLNS